jgi:thiol:disulfide interchange protein
MSLPARYTRRSALLGALALTLAACGARQTGPAPVATISAATDGGETVKPAAAAPSGKPVFIEFYADW